MLKNLVAVIALFLFLVAPRTAEAVCSSPAGVAGETLYNGDQKEMQYCDNTNWISMGRGPETGPGCTSPVATAGHVLFNKDYGVMQYCNGHEWVQMGIAGGDWKQIDVGSGAFTCGIKSNDTLWCWGQGQFGKLGDNTATTRRVPTAVSGGGTWKQVATGAHHACGIKSDDTIWCWGYNADGQLGDNSTTQRDLPTAINGGGTWKQVSTGGSDTAQAHTCGIKTDDTLWCWGDNSNGQIGDNTSGTNRLIPTAVNGGGTWKQVTAGGQHTCGIKTDDSLWCWGYNWAGALGDNSTTQRLIPTAINGGGTWKHVDGSAYFTCGIKTDDSLWCWGYNTDGQLGDNSTTQRLIPTAINGGGTWKRVDTGFNFTCGIKSADTLWCWGDNTTGQLGDNTIGTDRLIPTAISGGGTWKQAEAGGIYTGDTYFTCGIKADDTLWCWGYDASGQLGDNNFNYRTVPTPINGGNTWLQVSAGGRHTCGIRLTGSSLWCWGFNADGQLGDNSISTRLLPTTVSGGGSWKQVSAGGRHTCGIKSDDTLWCWGDNTNGQIGDNTSGTDRLVPTAISGGGTWKQVDTGGMHTCGIKMDDTLWCWGSNTDGQIGDNTSGTNRLIPTAINGGGTWKVISAGGTNTRGHSCGIKSDDTVWCWGDNTNGQIGDNTSGTDRLIPTAINGGGTWKQVSAGGDAYAGSGPHTCGIKSDDTLWCWGDNSTGQVGSACGGSCLVPATISGGGTWKQVSAGGRHTCGIKIDDTAWCWGNNVSGQLGDNSTSGSSVPTAVYGGGTYKQISGASSNNGPTCAIYSDDSILCWGENGEGQITATDGSAPFSLTGVLPYCVNPSAKPGTVLYNSDFAVLQYCGGRWVGIGK